MIIRRTYKLRLYPNRTQEAELLKILSGCRFVWNHFLAQMLASELETSKIPKLSSMGRELTILRRTAPELAGIQTRPLEQSLRRLNIAYGRYLKRLSDRPLPKQEESNRSSFQKGLEWHIEGNRVCVQKNLRIKARGSFPGEHTKTGTLIIKLEARSKWFATITAQEDIKVPKRHTKPIGIDVGLTSLAITSRGEKFGTLKPSYDLHAERHKLQRQLARQEMGSKRREKTLIALARLQHRMANVRMNHLHQTTNAILNKNPSMVAIEDLNIRGMVKNRRLARSLQDVSLGEFFRQIQYKQLWRGGEVIKVGRFFPSTKTCSKCGDINENMTLSTRNWTCLGCGEEHDRDINAAKNILQQAMAEVRPA